MFRLSVSDCFTARDISARTSIRKAGSRRSIQSTIQDSCPSGRCDSQTVNGYGCRFNFPDRGSGSAAGKCQLEEQSCIFSIPTTLPIQRLIAGITSELYGGDAEMRLKQEIVLGIGGWRLLRALGLAPEVCHLNEGHAAFAVLERARCYMEDHKKPFDLAMNITRAGNVFTTHTAVSAGFDRFDPALIRTYLSHYAVDELAISVEDLLAMGRQNPEDNFGTLQHGLSCGPRQRPDQWRQQAPRTSEPADLSALVSALATGRKFR